MGLTNKFLPVALMLLLLYFVKVMPHSFECNSGHTCFFPGADSLETKNRKLLNHLGNEPASSITSNGGNMVVWDQLRKAPSGPDPLHHNGGGSKKPRTP